LKRLPRHLNCLAAALAAFAALPAFAVQFQPLADLQTGIRVTVLTLGPEDPDPVSDGDGCIYAASRFGSVFRICFDDAKSVTSNTLVIDLNGADDVSNVQGIEIDPVSDPAGEIHLYLGYAVDADAPLNGRVARAVSTDGGASYAVDESFITGLTRSSFSISHQTNGLAFGPDGCLYVAQGNASNAGYDSIRAESRLSGAILRSCFKDANGDVDPTFDRNCGDAHTQESCDLEVYASGLRNPFDLIWHSNGRLYSTDNDANPGFRDDCGSEFNNFGCACQAPVVTPIGDELNLIEEGRYYGSPNPYRANPAGLQCQGGTSGGKMCTTNADCAGGGVCADLSDLCTDAVCGESVECLYFGDGEPPEVGEDPSGLYEEPISQIGATLDGIAEYKSRFDDAFPGSFCSDWNGHLLVTGGPRDVRRFSLSSDGGAATHQGTGNLNGAFGLDVVVGGDGTIYVADFPASKVTYLVPIEQTDPDAANFFRFCDTSLEAGAWDVPSAPASLPIGRSDHAAARLEIAGRDYIFVLGQRDTDEVLRYDGVADLWVSSSDLGTPGAPPDPPFPLTGPPTSHHKAAVSIDGAIYTIGGLDPADSSTWLYDGIDDPTANRLSEIGCNGSSQDCQGEDQVGTITGRGFRVGASAAAAMGDQIYVAGGLCKTTGAGAADCTCGGVPGGTAGNCAGNLAPGENTDRAFRYERSMDDWFEIASMPLAVDHAAGAAFDGKFYVFGGRQCGSHTPCEGRTDVQIYDPLTDSWSLGSPMPEGCSGMGNAVVLNHRIYVIGGEGGACTGTAVQEYEPFSDSWRMVADLPVAHHGIWPVVIGDPADGFSDQIHVAGGAPAGNSHHHFAFSCEECRGAGVGGGQQGDRDGDGFPDLQDNCPDEPNPTQDDDDGDMLGDACDPCLGDARNVGSAEGGSCNATSAALHRIDAGGGGFTDSLGLSWSADSNFSGGSTSATTDAIGGTPDPQLYQTARSGGSFGYSLNAGVGGDYLINLHFAEISFTADGQRLFDVFAPELADQLIDDLDIHAAVGHDAALVKSFVVRSGDGAIELGFALGAGGVDSATVSGIELYRIPQACVDDGDCPAGQFCDPAFVCQAIADGDSDGLGDPSDPCVSDPRNRCFGPVAVDGITGSEIRLNAGSGGTCAGTRQDCNGDTWLGDFGFTGGNSEECDLVDGCPVDAAAIFGCSDAQTEDLFQCSRKDPPPEPELRYSFDVPDGSYLVNLLFMNASMETAAVGSRIFDVSIEGSLVHEAFDPVEVAGGSGIPVARSSLVTVSDGDGLQIVFEHLVGNPDVSGIEVRAAAPPQIPALSLVGLGLLACALATVAALNARRRGIRRAG
jgi:glucose/arabinose dehydrogenase